MIASYVLGLLVVFASEFPDKLLFALLTEVFVVRVILEFQSAPELFTLRTAATRSLVLVSALVLLFGRQTAACLRVHFLAERLYLLQFLKQVRLEFNQHVEALSDGNVSFAVEDVFNFEDLDLGRRRQHDAFAKGFGQTVQVSVLFLERGFLLLAQLALLVDKHVDILAHARLLRVVAMHLPNVHVEAHKAGNRLLP